MPKSDAQQESVKGEGPEVALPEKRIPEQKQALVEAAKAMMTGLALGDALGWPTEFRHMDQIYAEFGSSGIQQPPNPAIFTDDTQMTIAVARALIAHHDRDIPTLMTRMSEEFVEWGFSSENNRAPGTSCMQGVRQLAAGALWSDAGGLQATGCGSAMRAAPIGFVYQNSPEMLRCVAIASSLPTHRHPSAIASAVAAAYLIKLALDDVPVAELTSRTRSFIGGMSPELDAAFDTMERVLSWSDEVAAMDEIGGGWVGYEAVPLALYCVLRYPDSWVDTVRRGANFAGDSDSIASIAGGIQAIRLGRQSIPEDWLQHLERREELEALGVGLAMARNP